jgi:hypothetical protein
MGTGGRFWTGVGVGVALTLAAAALTLGVVVAGTGAWTVDVPVQTVLPVFRQGAEAALGAGLDTAVTQAVEQQVGPVLAGVVISVDGVAVRLPAAARRRIAARLGRRVAPAVERAARRWVAGPGLTRALSATLGPHPLEVFTRLGPAGWLRVHWRVRGGPAPSAGAGGA